MNKTQICIVGAALAVLSIFGQQVWAESACRKDSAVEARIGEALKVHVEGHLAQDPLLATSIYMDDFWFRGDNGFDLRTRSAFETFYTELYKNSQHVDQTYASDEILVCGDVAIDIGSVSSIAVIDGQQTTTRDHYLAVWLRQPDGSWKLSRATMSALPEQP